MPTTYELLEDAIQNKKIVHANYKGYYREMCPHALGYKNGIQNCLLYQFGGESKSGLAPAGSPKNWRCVYVEDLTQVEIVGGPWHSAPNHSRPQTCIDQIEVEVSF
jgi:hypothetical protein